MKSKLKKILTAIILSVIICFASGCSSLSLANYLKTNNDNNLSVENLLPTNGVDGKDGKDGESIDLYKIYEQLKELNQYDGTYAEFVKDYLGIEDTTYATNKGLNSVVSIIAGFTSTVQYQNGPLSTDTFETKAYSAGSGVIFRLDKESGDAYIITNYHVVYDHESSTQISTDINLFLYGQEIYTINTLDSISIDWKTYYYKQLSSSYSIPATYIGGSMQYDIAVLKVTNSEILKKSSACAATFANSNDISVGDKTIAIGNASSMGLSATQGVISVDSEYISMTGADGETACTFRVLRTDAAINGGNSGGGLFNSSGEVIGIVNAKITATSIENIGYALPSTVAVNVAENIIRNCDGETRTTVKRCIMGINIYAHSSSAHQVIKNGKTKTEIIETIVVDSVTEGSVAEGKLKAGDRIITFQIIYSSGESKSFTPTRTFHLIDASLTLSAGDTIIISTINSDGTQNTDVSITFSSEDIVEFK